MINNKEKKMIQRYCIYPKIAVVALIFSFVQCALIVPLEMIDDLVFQNKGFQPTGMFTALGFVIIYVIIFCFCALAPKFGMNGKKWKSLIGRLNVKQSETDSVRRQGEGTCQSGGAVHFPQKSKRGVRVENILTTKYKKFVEFKI